MRTSAAPLLTPEEQATITAALPSIRQAAPDAANIIVRLLDDAATRETTPSVDTPRSPRSRQPSRSPSRPSATGQTAAGFRAIGRRLVRAGSRDRCWPARRR